MFKSDAARKRDGGFMIVIAHSFFLRRDPKQLARCKPYPPLATLLGAALLRREGHDVALFDATFEESVPAFEVMLDRLRPEAVVLLEDNFNFLTKMCTESRRNDALEMVRIAAARGCYVAVNGPDASDSPRLYLDAGADAVLAGEGEFALADFVHACGLGSEALRETAGLILPDVLGGLRRTAPRGQQRDLDNVPLPAWDLVDHEAYRRAWTDAHGYFSWQMAASRGCPYGCNWCAKPTFGRGYTQRSPGNVAEEMQRLKDEVAPDHIWFSDDIFGMTAEWISDFAREVVQRDARIPFMIQSRVNLIDANVAEALAAAGAQEVWLGVESGSQRVLDAMDKGSRVDSARVATRHLKRAGIKACWFLQLGYPPEDWADIVMTRDLVLTESPDDIGVSVAYPLPGTVFYDRVAAQLGKRRNWRDTDELAMLFQGAYDTAFYRMVRDALHADVVAGSCDEALWDQLARLSLEHRSQSPVRLAIVS